MAESASEVGSNTSDLRELLESGEGADVALVIGESQLPAHSFMLAARSPVFAAMLRNDMEEATSRRIGITDMREAVARQMLSFIYTDTAPELEGMAAELLEAADKYDLPLLKKKCEQQMAQGLNVENAAATAALAVLHCCPELMSTAVEFIAGHLEVMATNGWARLQREHAEAAVEVSQQVAALNTATKKSTSNEPQSSESRTVPAAMKQKMASRLMEAARRGRAREVWALLAAGAPKDARDGDGNTALHLAASGGHASTVRCLLDGGLDANAANSSGQTPLHVAAGAARVTVMWMLVAASACVDAQDNQGQTPLHVAAQLSDTTSYEEIVNTLLLAGARTDINDSRGRTPQRVATRSTKNAFNTSSITSTTCHPYYDLA